MTHDINTDVNCRVVIMVAKTSAPKHWMVWTITSCPVTSSCFIKLAVVAVDTVRTNTQVCFAMADNCSQCRLKDRPMLGLISIMCVDTLIAACAMCRTIHYTTVRQ